MSTTPTTPDPSRPIEIELGNGMVIKGSNFEEAIQNAKKIVTDNVTAYRTEKEKREQAEAEAERLRQEAEQRQNVIEQASTPRQNAGFDSERYYQLLNDDPMAAQNYMDQVRFGVADPVRAFHAMREESWANVQQNVTTAFIANHPEWNPADTQALSGRVQALLEYGLPFNAATMHYAFEAMKQDGSAHPVELQPEPGRELPDPPLNPSLNGGSGSAGFGSVDPDNLSDADLARLLRSRGMM